MKIPSLLLVRFAFLLISINLTTQAGAQQKNTERYEFNNISELSVSGNLRVHIIQNGNEELTLEGDTDILEQISIEQIKGELRIKRPQKHSLWRKHRDKTAIVYLSVKQLERIKGSDGADLMANGLKSPHLELKFSSGSDGIIDNIEVNTLVCHASSGADARLSGTVSYFEAKASSGADIIAYDLQSRKGVAKASSGSDIKLSVSEALNAHASSGADIYYKGNPESLSALSSSGGSIRRKK